MTSVNRYLVSALPKFGIPKPVFTRHSVPNDNGLGEIIESLGTLDPRILAAKIALADDPKDVTDEAKSLILDTSHSWSDFTANNPNLAIILPIGKQKVSLVKANGDSGKPVSLRFFNNGFETVFSPDDNPEFRLETFVNQHLDEIQTGSPVYNNLKELVIRYDVQTSPEVRTEILGLMNEIIQPFANQSKIDRQSNHFNSILMEHPFSPNFDLVFKLDNQGKLTDILIYEPLASSAELENPDFFLVARSAT
jgi:hypothetical protein